LAYTNVRAFNRAQVAIEATRGTAIGTMTRWVTALSDGGLSWSYVRDREDAPETLRSFQADRDTAITQESVTWQIEARLAYEEIPWWLSCALNGAAATLVGTTTGSTPPGYTYTITAVDTSDDLDTFTMKIGDPSVCYILKRCAVNQLTIRCNPDQGGEASWRIVASGPAIFVGTGTFDAPSDITRTIVQSYGSLMYLDTSSAIGTTSITGLVRNFEFTINNNIEEKRFIDAGVAAHTDFGRGFQRVTGSFSIEHTADTYFAYHRAETDIKLRFEKTGATIGSSPTTAYRTRWDFPQAVLDSPTESFVGNNRVYTYPFLAEKPSGASSIQTATVIASTPVLA
jgi:hypothetical protein